MSRSGPFVLPVLLIAGSLTLGCRQEQYYRDDIPYSAWPRTFPPANWDAERSELPLLPEPDGEALPPAPDFDVPQPIPEGEAAPGGVPVPVPDFGGGAPAPQPGAGAPPPAGLYGDDLSVGLPPAVTGQDPYAPLHEAAVGPVDYGEPILVEAAPPPLLYEEPPPSPGLDYSWISGYWWWSFSCRRHIWITGCWRRPPVGCHWSAGYWARHGRHCSWVPGCWLPRGSSRCGVAYNAPPPCRRETIPHRPSPDHCWRPGSYEHRNGGYHWNPGCWERPPRPGCRWVEPQFVKGPDRWYCRPGRWDHAPDQCAKVFPPVTNPGRGSPIRPVTPLPTDVVCRHAEHRERVGRFCADNPTRPLPPTLCPPAGHRPGTFARGPHGNNGVGNGRDPQPPGNPPINDGPGTGPGHPGNKKGGDRTPVLIGGRPVGGSSSGSGGDARPPIRAMPDLKGDPNHADPRAPIRPLRLGADSSIRIGGRPAPTGGPDILVGGRPAPAGNPDPRTPIRAMPDLRHSGPGSTSGGAPARKGDVLPDRSGGSFSGGNSGNAMRRPSPPADSYSPPPAMRGPTSGFSVPSRPNDLEYRAPQRSEPPVYRPPQRSDPPVYSPPRSGGSGSFGNSGSSGGSAPRFDPTPVRPPPRAEPPRAPPRSDPPPRSGSSGGSRGGSSGGSGGSSGSSGGKGGKNK
jgi:hypothetical protein